VSLNRVIRGSFWLYVSGISSNLLGYVYWLMASWFVPPSTIGESSAIVGVVSLISGLVSLGVSSGATRLFGKALAQPDSRRQLSSWFSSSLAVTLALYASAAVATLLAGPLLGVTQLQLPFVISLIILAAFPQVSGPLYNASLRTGVIALSSILSASFRLMLGLLLLYLGTGFAGVMLAFVIAGVVQHVVLAAALRGSISAARPSLPQAKETVMQGPPRLHPIARRDGRLLARCLPHLRHRRLG
jgi:O-antigen/teichoic acid export membrane protein